ncbi:hypothetical protein NX059_010535 [Plenodomus lindquistii]|nr:hypothetical protein NX059_010535 [Plenodomus lindquistii]
MFLRRALGFVSLVGVCAAQQAFFDAIGGRVDPPAGSNLREYGALNNDRCWKQFDAEACEDVKIHEASSTAFLACGSLAQREIWYPPLERRNTSAPQPYVEYFMKYDIERNVSMRMQIEGLPEGADLVLHGFDLRQVEGDPSEIQIFAVNHARQGELITIFNHTLGSDTLRFVKSYSHPAIKSPNQVTAAGPSSFFTGNDHYFYNGSFREFEVANGPFTWASDIVYCSEGNATNQTLTCTSVSPPNAHLYLNGVLLIDEGRKLLAADSFAQTVTVYDVGYPGGNLTRNATYALGATPDNLSIDSPTGDIIVAAIPEQSSSSASAVRLVKQRGYAPEVLFWDDGNQVEFVTAAAVDRRQERLVLASIVEAFYLVCEVDL